MTRPDSYAVLGLLALGALAEPYVAEVPDPLTRTH